MDFCLNVIERALHDVEGAMGSLTTAAPQEQRKALQEYLGTLLLWRQSFSTDALATILSESEEVKLAILRDVCGIGSSLLKRKSICFK